LAIELARLGYQVTGLDISQTFVDIAREKARAAGVTVDFQLGDASRMPFEAGRFDFVTCWSAFKNFADPAGALAEMHRVLRPGGAALVDDLRRDAPLGAIRDRVDQMRLGPLNAWLTRLIFRRTLLPRAYTGAELERLVAGTAFARSEVREKPIELAVWLQKAA
jgi:ubiquinone/menaquinone biosynthesis C-methylase UbiE